MRLVYNDLVSLMRDRPIGRLWEWVSLNPYTALFWPAVLGVEALILLNLNLPAGGMAAVGAFFFFMSFMWSVYAGFVGLELSSTKGMSEGRRGRIADHVGYTNAVALTLLMGVVAIECSIRASGGLWGPTWLLVTHLVFVFLGSFAFVVARFVLTGLKNPERHKVWVWIFLATFGVTLGTGTTLILVKFPLT